MHLHSALLKRNIPLHSKPPTIFFCRFGLAERKPRCLRREFVQVAAEEPIQVERDFLLYVVRSPQLRIVERVPYDQLQLGGHPCQQAIEEVSRLSIIADQGGDRRIDVVVDALPVELLLPGEPAVHESGLCRPLLDAVLAR